jgi:hypothetical protein
MCITVTDKNSNHLNYSALLKLTSVFNSLNRCKSVLFTCSVFLHNIRQYLVPFMLDKCCYPILPVFVLNLFSVNYVTITGNCVTVLCP